ncbi:MAG: hypothetical protein KAR07_09930 [Spirochaetes bacterium]|nr:hypothetical protein [Spirochaetota bacterium]
MHIVKFLALAALLIVFPVEISHADTTEANYEIIKIEDTSGENTKEVIVSVVLPNVETADDMGKIVEEIVGITILKRPDLDLIGFHLYSSKDHLSSLPDLGLAQWGPEGFTGHLGPNIAKKNIRDNYEITIKINEFGISALKARKSSDVMFGLTEQRRRTIFTEIIEAAARAKIEADRVYPTDPERSEKTEAFLKNLEYREKILKEYENEIYVKFKISKEIGSAISQEAIEELWPLP